MRTGGAASFMSIINDALKKVQTNLNLNNSNPIKNTMTTPPENSQPTNLPEPDPKPNYDTQLGQPSAPWDIPTAQPNNAPAPPPQPAPQKEIVKKQNVPTVSRSTEKKSSRLKSLVIVLFVVIAATIFILQKNKQWLAEHNIHLRLPEKIQKIFSLPKDMLAQKTKTPPDPAATAAAKKDELVVNAVMSKNNQHIALINDKIYKVGDSINGMKILKINFQEMIVQNGEKEKTIAVLK